MPPAPTPHVRLCRHGLDLGAGGVLPLWSGALHYWRVPQVRWDEALAGVVSLGFSAVETYVPWAVHEIAPGDYDFGARDGRHDLGRFLERAHAAGLKVLLRPGPHINAELTFYGFPERILADPALGAVTARGTPAFLPAPPRAFPVPSYASRRFLEEAAAWLRAFAAVARPHLYPAGPVVAIQVDNECAYFFRSGAYDLDYHPDAIAAFRAFLAARYGDEAALRAAWRRPVSLAALEPPRRFAAQAPEDLVEHLDWIAFKEHLIASALGELAQVLRAAGLGVVPLFHNLPPAEPAANGLVAIERALDCCGVDYHHPGRDYARVRERVLYQRGSSVLAYAPELGAGAMAVGLRLQPEEQRHIMLAALMHGLRGANVYMAVDRERWYGAPLSKAGVAVAPLGPFLRRLGAALKETGLFALERSVDVALLVPPAYRRLMAATGLLEAMPPMVLEYASLGGAALCREDRFGLAGPVQLEADAAHRALTRALAHAHVPYLIVDGGADPVRLAGYRVLVCPTFDFIDRALAVMLAEAAAAGVRVIAGPRPPAWDERFGPLAVALPAPELTPELLADESRLADFLGAVGAKPDFAAREPEVDTVAYYGADGTPQVLFVGTGARAPLTATVAVDGAMRLTDVITGEVIAAVGEAPIALERYGVRMFRLAPAAGGAS
jgi:beta-galactosidase